jgi:hypothetical protein
VSEESFARIGPPWWSDRPVAIVGNGPSLRGFDFERLRGFHVLAVKGSMFNVPWAAAGFGLDIPRYVEWCGMLKRVPFVVYWATPNISFLGSGPHANQVRFLRRIDAPFMLSDDPHTVYSGGSSGYGALNVAWLKRAKRIALLGFEYNADAAGHADTRAFIDKSRVQDPGRWKQWAQNFGCIKRQLELAGVKVINAAPDSRITAFPKMTIEDALREVQRTSPGTA